MGVDYYVLEAGTTSLNVGGVTSKVGKLRRVGKSGERTTNQLAAAAAAWDGRAMPPAVFVPGTADISSGAEGIVLAWEPGLSSTQDHDWDRLKLLGYAWIGEDGKLELRATDRAERAMGGDEALAAGIVDAKGKLLPGRRPRVVSAMAERGVSYTHRNPSSTGPVDEPSELLVYQLEDGHSVDFPMAPVLTDEARAALNAGAAAGMTADELHRWVGANALRDQRAEKECVRVLGDGLLRLSSQAGTVALQPELRRGGGFGLVVRNRCGFPMAAEDAFLEAGDALAGSGDGPHDARAVGEGYLALEVGEGSSALGLLLVPLKDGGIGVQCGPAFPREVRRDTSMRHDAPRGGADAAISLLGWPGEQVVVPAERVAPFLADFALYLAECGGEALAAGREGRAAEVPMFQQFLDRREIIYGPEPGGPGIR